MDSIFLERHQVALNNIGKARVQFIAVIGNGMGYFYTMEIMGEIKSRLGVDDITHITINSYEKLEEIKQSNDEYKDSVLSIYNTEFTINNLQNIIHTLRNCCKAVLYIDSVESIDIKNVDINIDMVDIDNKDRMEYIDILCNKVGVTYEYGYVEEVVYMQTKFREFISLAKQGIDLTKESIETYEVLKKLKE